MVAAGKVEFGQVHQHRIGYGEARRFHLAALSGSVSERPQGFGVGHEPSELVANVADPREPVVLGEQKCRANQQVH